MPVQFKKFDIRRLLANGVEPFPEIRRRIDALGLNEGLTIIAPFLPSPLIEKLSSEGFCSRVEHQANGSWMVHFSRDDA